MKNTFTYEGIEYKFTKLGDNLDPYYIYCNTEHNPAFDFSLDGMIGKVEKVEDGWTSEVRDLGAETFASFFSKSSGKKTYITLSTHKTRKDAGIEVARYSVKSMEILKQSPAFIINWDFHIRGKIEAGKTFELVEKENKWNLITKYGKRKELVAWGSDYELLKEFMNSKKTIHNLSPIGNHLNYLDRDIILLALCKHYSKIAISH